MDSTAEFLRRTFALDGRVALVTGASSGLGAHMAGTLARAGCKVALAARRAARLEARTVVDTDLSAVWRVGQVAAQRMAAQKTGGTIINIASILGLGSQRAQANYGAAKAGVLHLTRTMARELARSGVRVNALAPGYFATEMNREFFATERGRDYLEKLLPGRPGELHELDGALLLLAGDAGSYITGSTITVDGGALLGGL